MRHKPGNGVLTVATLDMNKMKPTESNGLATEVKSIKTFLCHYTPPLACVMSQNLDKKSISQKSTSNFNPLGSGS
jgi:hypothetical protein